MEWRAFLPLNLPVEYFALARPRRPDYLVDVRLVYPSGVVRRKLRHRTLSRHGRERVKGQKVCVFFTVFDDFRFKTKILLRVAGNLARNA